MMRQTDAARAEKVEKEKERGARGQSSRRSKQQSKDGVAVRSNTATGGVMAVVVLFIFGGIWMMTQGRSPSVPPSASADPSISPVPFITSSLDALGAESSAAASVDVAAAADPKVVSAGGGGAAAAVELEAKSKVVKAAVESKAEVEVAESPPPPRPRTFNPPAPPQSFTRWAALSIPTTCLRPGVSPSGIIPGLELHDREGVDAHYMRPEGTTEAVTSPEALQKTAAQEAAHEEVMDKVQDAKEELKEAVEELQEEVQEAKDTADAVELETKGGILDVAEVEAADGGDSDDSITSATGTAADANAMDETTGAVDETAAPAEEDPPAGADADVAADPSLSPELPSGVLAADVAESKHRRLLAAPAFSRRLLRNKGPHPETPKQPEYPEQPDPTPAVRTPAVRVPRQRSAGPTHNPLLLTKGDAEAYETSAQTEKKVMHLVANVSLFDIACQFTTAECGDAAALQLAAALRADAEAVINPDVTPEELRRVSYGLASMHSNSRTMLNASALPAMGKAGALGSCALSSDAEYDPAGRRYDATVSRFATVIDLHDTLVYCAPKAHYCKFTKLTSPVSEVTVRLDASSYLMAKTQGAAIHRALSGDRALGGGVVNWGHAGDPTHQFISTIMLLRSGLCSRLDIYGQPSVPMDWYRSQGYGHITAVPGPSAADKVLAKTLVQERFFYRVVMHEGKMCFFK